MSPRSTRLRAVVLAMLVAAAVLPVAAPVAVAGTSIVVDTLVDAVGDDGACGLYEAITAAETNAPSGATPGECPAGSAVGGDVITFTVPKVTLTRDLPEIQHDLTIDGGGTTTVDGADAYRIITASTGDITIKDVTLTKGMAAGGAVLTSTTTLLDGVTVTDNAGQYAGGIFGNGAVQLTITDTVITGNSGTDAGGGIALQGGTLSVSRSRVSGNSGAGGGGIALSNGTVATVTTSTISGNTAASGAGISVGGVGTGLTIANSTIAGNTASGVGGGIYNGGASVSGVNVTITGNTDSGQGGGYYETMTAVNDFSNTILSGNTPFEYFGSVSATGNLVGIPEGMTLGSILDSAGLRDNGGPTPTVRLTNSLTNPALDAGNSAVCAAAPVNAIDQRGRARPSACDLGAVELERTAPTITSAPKLTIRGGQPLSGSSSRARLAWAGSDPAGGTGLRAFIVQRSLNGGAWTTVATQLKGTYDVSLLKDRSYRFRVRAVDLDGNSSAYSSTPTVTARLYQQSSSRFSFAGTWRTKTATVFSGGSARRATTRGASFSFTATGRAFAFVTTMGPTRGKARIYVNGTLVKTVDLFAGTTAYRVQAWTRHYSSAVRKTIRVVVLGTTDRPRIDADAFVVLQ